MSNFKKILLLWVGLLSFSTPVFAEGVAVGGRIGTLGVGVEMAVGILPWLNARLGVNRFDYSYEGTESDVDYDMDLNLDSWNALLDWYLLGTFHLTGGYLFNKNALDVSANLQSGTSYAIGEANFSRQQIGNLEGTLDFENSAWYFGMGWGNPVDRDKFISLSFDLGVVLQGSPNATLTSTGGTLSNNAFFLENLDQEEADLEEALDSLNVYPVVSLGIAVHF